MQKQEDDVEQGPKGPWTEPKGSVGVQQFPVTACYQHLLFSWHQQARQGSTEVLFAQF